jgi:hypothetical protein
MADAERAAIAAAAAAVLLPGKGASDQPFADRPRWHADSATPAAWRRPNHYPPAVLLLLRRAAFVRERPFLRRYLAALHRRFRRVVVVTDNSTAFNARFHPFPAGCFEGARVTECLLYALKHRGVRRAGGVLVMHGDAFVDPRAVFAGGALDAVLASNQCPDLASGGRNTCATDIWKYWQYALKPSRFTGLSYETGKTRWNRGAPIVSTFFREYRAANGGVERAMQRRAALFSDIFYIPSRLFDLTAELLHLDLPFSTMPEGYVGFLASVLQAAAPVFWRPLRYKGHCCRYLNTAAIKAAPAGHKAKLRTAAHVAAMTAKVDDAFDCAERATPRAATMAALREDVALLARAAGIAAWPPPGDALQPVLAAFADTTCNITATVAAAALAAGTSFVQLVAPMSNDVTVELPPVSQRGAQRVVLFLHAPNANVVTVRCGGATLNVEVFITTGVTLPTSVAVDVAERSAGGKALPRSVALDEGRDVLAVRAPRLQLLVLRVDSGTHGESSAALSVVGAVDAIGITA